MSVLHCTREGGNIPSPVVRRCERVNLFEPRRHPRLVAEKPRADVVWIGMPSTGTEAGLSAKGTLRVTLTFCESTGEAIRSPAPSVTKRSLVSSCVVVLVHVHLAGSCVYVGKAPCCPHGP